MEKIENNQNKRNNSDGDVQKSKNAARRKRRYYSKKKSDGAVNGGDKMLKNNSLKDRPNGQNKSTVKSQKSTGPYKGNNVASNGNSAPKSSTPKKNNGEVKAKTGNAPRMNRSELSIVQVLQDTPGSIFIYTSHKGIITKVMLTDNYDLMDMDNGGYFTEYVPEDAYDFIWVGKRDFNN